MSIAQEEHTVEADTEEEAKSKVKEKLAKSCGLARDGWIDSVEELPPFVAAERQMSKIYQMVKNSRR